MPARKDFVDLPEGIDSSLAFDLDDFDRDDALRAEAEAKPIPVKIEDKWIHFPQTSQWPYSATAALDEGELIEALRILFDPDADEVNNIPDATERQRVRDDRRDTIERLESLAGKRVAVIARLFEHITDKSGVGLGESRAQRRHSRSSRRK